MYAQPRVVGYTSYQVTTRTTVALPVRRRERSFSASSISIPNPGTVTVYQPGGPSRGENSTQYQNVRNVQKPPPNENIPSIAPRTVRHLSEAAHPPPNLVPLNPHNRTGGVSRGGILTVHQSARNSLSNVNIPVIQPRTARTQEPASYVRHRRQSDASTLSRRIQPSQSQQQQLPVPRPQERNVSHAPLSLPDQKHRYPKPDFFCGQFDNFSIYDSSARIAAHFISDRFPVIKRDQIQPFVYHILYVTHDRPNIMYGALLLLQRLKVMDPRWQPDETLNFPCYIFICAYLIARKFILDDWVQNKALLHAMEPPFNLRTLNYLERTLMKDLGYNLTIDSALLSDFSKKIKNDFLSSSGPYPVYRWNMVSKTDPRADRLGVASF